MPAIYARGRPDATFSMPASLHPVDMLTLYEGDARDARQLAERFLALEWAMGYTQRNIVWGSLAISRARALADGTGVIYSLDLARPIQLDALDLPDPSLQRGCCTGRLTLTLSDPRFAPVFTDMDAQPAIARTDAGRAGASGTCRATLRLENLRPSLHDVAQHDTRTGSSSGSKIFSSYAEYFQSEAAEAYNMLRDMKHSLTSFLHPDIPPGRQLDYSQYYPFW